MLFRSLLESPSGILIKTTLVDFPSRVASTFFLRGCNIRCPYCYNIDLIYSPEEKDSSSTDFVSANVVLKHLEKRKGLITGFVLSGGEPLINPLTPILIQKAKELGYKIKLDTNGTNPKILSSFLSDQTLKPDFVAMDIKTSPSRYGKDIPVCKVDGNVQENLLDSINLLKSLPSESREFRTVLVPPLISKEDISTIAALLPEDASWQFAQFRNENCLDKSYNDIYPYTDKQAQELVNYAKTLRNGAALR